METSVKKYTSSNKKIAKNTLMLYFRQILIMFVSLYTVRVVLKTLGAEDYGIYNAVAGVVTMLNFLTGSMASATQRFFSFALGEGDNEKLNKVFNVNMFIYAAIALIAVVLLETLGLWFTAKELSIPDGRYDAAIAIYHFAVISFLFGIFSSPFAAIIIAHEDMHIYAGVSIIEALLKLGVVFALMAIPGDKLTIYGELLAIVAFVNVAMYGIICFTRYDECRLSRKKIDKGMLREVTGFTGWTLFGQLTTVARHQVMTVMINQFFNPVVVAARAIASNVTHAANVFGSNFNTSLYPPIIKEYAAGNKKEMYALIFNGCKMTFFLFWILALPLMVEMETILRIWLVDVPEHAVTFTILSLIEVLINSVSQPLATAARAPGRMKTYELTLGILQLMIPIVSLPLFYAGFPAATVFYVAIAINIIMFGVRLPLVSRLTGLPVGPFTKKVILPMLLVAALSLGLSIRIKYLLPEGIGYSIINIIVAVLSASLAMYYIGLGKQQRERLVDTILKKLKIKLR